MQSPTASEKRTTHLGDSIFTDPIESARALGCSGTYLLFSQRECGNLLLETKMAVL